MFKIHHMCLLPAYICAQGFDAKGNENFWTVTGDNVSAMMFMDIDGDGRRELVVGGGAS